MSEDEEEDEDGDEDEDEEEDEDGEEDDEDEEDEELEQCDNPHDILDIALDAADEGDKRYKKLFKTIEDILKDEDEDCSGYDKDWTKNDLNGGGYRLDAHNQLQLAIYWSEMASPWPGHQGNTGRRDVLAYMNQGRYLDNVLNILKSRYSRHLED
jgi:hypothetical protein